MKVRMVLVPTVLCVVCSILLYWVYGVTNPKIETDIACKLKTHLMEVIFPEAKEYKALATDTAIWVAYDPAGEIIGIAGFKCAIPDTVWSVFDTSDNQIGIAFKVFPTGYGGPIEILVGLGMDTTVAGIRPATPSEGLKETPGLGNKINELWFRHQFIGKKEDDVRLKKDGGTLDAITSATISSRAVANGVRKGIGKYKKYLSK